MKGKSNVDIGAIAGNLIKSLQKEMLLAEGQIDGIRLLMENVRLQIEAEKAQLNKATQTIIEEHLETAAAIRREAAKVEVFKPMVDVLRQATEVSKSKAKTNAE